MSDYSPLVFSPEFEQRLKTDPEFAEFVAKAKRQEELMRPFYEAEMREELERDGRMKFIMEYFKARGEKQKEWLTEMKGGSNG